MSTDPTESSITLPATRSKRLKQLDILCKKYCMNLFNLTSLDTLHKYFDEQDIKDAELGYAFEQMMEYSKSHLPETIATVFEDEHIKERIEHIEALSDHKEKDYESVFANSINQQFGEHGADFHRVVPKPTEVSRAELYKLKQKQLEQLQAHRDSLRLENKARMEELNKKKQARQNMVNPLPAFTPQNLGSS